MILKLALLLVILSLGATPAIAEVNLVNKQGTSIEAERFHFQDEAGNQVTLKSFLNPKQPVFLAPIFFRCPGTCTVTLNTLFTDLRRLGYNPGKALQVVVFSIDPTETSSLAKDKKSSYMERFKYQAFADGFHFLTGDRETIHALTDKLGFHYEERDGQFYHPGAYYLLTPEGLIAKTYSGKPASLRKLREAIFFAANGRKLSSFEKMVNACAPKADSRATASAAQ